VVYKDGTTLKFYQFTFDKVNLPQVFLEDTRNQELLGEMTDQVMEKINNLSDEQSFQELYELLKKTPGYLKKKQWYLSAGKITDSSKGDVLRSEYLTEIEIDPEKLKQLSSQYVDQVGQYVTQMFNSLKDLSGNINAYVTDEKRSDAVGSAKKASGNAESIRDATLQQIEQEK